jgi:hypothetical protein
MRKTSVLPFAILAAANDPAILDDYNLIKQPDLVVDDPGLPC